MKTVSNLVIPHKASRHHGIVRAATGQSGVTMIELLIVLAILGVILGIGAISFGGQAEAARRTDACAMLVNASNFMEQYAMANGNSYSGAQAGITIPAKSPADGSRIFYQLTITNLSATTYQVNAIPQQGQVGDECGTLWVDQSGTRGADLAIEECCR